MDFPRLKRFNRQWEKTPPLPVSVAAIAACLGVKFTAAPGGSAPGETAGTPVRPIAGEVLDMLISEEPPAASRQPSAVTE